MYLCWYRLYGNPQLHHSWSLSNSEVHGDSCDSDRTNPMFLLATGTLRNFQNPTTFRNYSGTSQRSRHPDPGSDTKKDGQPKLKRSRGITSKKQSRWWHWVQDQNASARDFSSQCIKSGDIPPVLLTAVDKVSQDEGERACMCVRVGVSDLAFVANNGTIKTEG
jgi:hypothetical protein